MNDFFKNFLRSEKYSNLEILLFQKFQVQQHILNLFVVDKRQMFHDSFRSTRLINYFDKNMFHKQGGLINPIIFIKLDQFDLTQKFLSDVTRKNKHGNHIDFTINNCFSATDLFLRYLTCRLPCSPLDSPTLPVTSDYVKTFASLQAAVKSMFMVQRKINGHYVLLLSPGRDKIFWMSDLDWKTLEIIATYQNNVEGFTELCKELKE